MKKKNEDNRGHLHTIWSSEKEQQRGDHVKPARGDGGGYRTGPRRRLAPAAGPRRPLSTLHRIARGLSPCKQCCVTFSLQAS